MFNSQSTPEDIYFGSLEVEEIARNPSVLVGFLQQAMEKLAQDNLKKSPNEQDRKAVVKVERDSTKSFVVRVERPPVDKNFKINKKELMPGRYFEIHGPGGRVKITTKVSVMEKAKKQGVHVQTKHKMPNGKTPVTFSIYDTQQTEGGLEKPLSKKQIIDPKSLEYQSLMIRTNRLMEQNLEAIFDRAS